MMLTLFSIIVSFSTLLFQLTFISLFSDLFSSADLCFEDAGNFCLNEMILAVLMANISFQIPMGPLRIFVTWNLQFLSFGTYLHFSHQNSIGP